MTSVTKIERLLKREQDRLDSYKKIYNGNGLAPTTKSVYQRYIIEQQDKLMGILMALQEIL